MDMHGGDMEAAATWLITQAPERQGSRGGSWAGSAGPSPRDTLGSSGGGATHTRVHSIAAGRQTLMAVTGRSPVEEHCVHNGQWWWWLQM